MAGLMDAMNGMGGGMMPPQAAPGPEAMPQAGPQDDQMMQIVMMAQQILGRPPRDLQEAVETVFQQGQQQAPAPTGGQGTAPPPMPPPGMPQGMQGMPQGPMGFAPLPPMMRR